MKEAPNIKNEPDELERTKLAMDMMDDVSKACSTVSNAIEKNEP